MGNAPATLRIGIDTPCIQSGQEVCGKVYIMVTKETQVTTLNLTLRGQEYAKVHYNNSIGFHKLHLTVTDVKTDNMLFLLQICPHNNYIEDEDECVPASVQIRTTFSIAN